MLSKSGEVPERCCVNTSQFEERSPSNFLRSSLRQDREVPGRPQVLRASRPHARPDFDGTRSSRKPGANEFPEIPPHENIAITISVIEGPSKNLTDFEFDEPETSDVHCIIAARQNEVRLYVAPTVNNIYVNDQRIYTVELGHMSTFRVGSSLLLVRVLPNQPADIRKSKGAEK